MADVRVTQAVSAYDQIAKMATDKISLVAEPEGPAFDELVSHAVNSSMDTLYKAENMTTKSLLGKADLHDLVTAVSAAELTLNTVVAIRDRVISAYHDIVKMPI